MKICTVPVHGFSQPKLDCHLPKLERMCFIPEKTAKKKCIDAASDITFACYDIIAGADLGTTSIKGYVYGDVLIRLG